MGDIFDSTWHPEDELPGWVFNYDVCDNCEGAVDGNHDYEEYGIEICNCIDCKICNELTDEESDWLVVNIPIGISKNAPYQSVYICYSCSCLIQSAIDGDIYQGE